jgi:hypothetical protein
MRDAWRKSLPHHPAAGIPSASIPLPAFRRRPSRCRHSVGVHPAAGIPSASIPLLPVRYCSGCASRQAIVGGCPTVDARAADAWYCRCWGAGDYSRHQDFPACSAFSPAPVDAAG